jgi:hypothetical protein
VAGNVVGVIVEAADKPGSHGNYSKIKKRASTFIVADWELGPDSVSAVGAVRGGARVHQNVDSEL